MAKTNILSYRPHNLTLSPTEEMLIQHHGVAFFGVRDVLEILINGDGVYYLRWTDEVRSLVSVKCHISEGRVSEILKEMIRRNYYDKTIFERYKVLTNAETQEWFIGATKRRKKVVLIKQFLSSSVISKLGENVVFKQEIADKNEQRKGKQETHINNNTNINLPTCNKERKGQPVPLSELTILINKFKLAFPDRYTDDVECIYDNVDMDLLIAKIKESSFLRGNHWRLVSCLKNYDKIINNVYADDKVERTIYVKNAQSNPAAVKGHNLSKEQLDGLFDDLNQIEI